MGLLERRHSILQGTDKPPFITGAVVEDANPDQIVISLDEVCTGTTVGWTIRINGAIASKSGFSGSGSSTFTITLYTSVLGTDLVTVDYDEDTGDTKNAGNVPLQTTAVPIAVTNNVATQPSIYNFTVTGSGNSCRLFWSVAGAIPSSFYIERRVNGGIWGVANAAYTPSDPYASYRMGGINRNFYYVDTQLNPDDTYEYRIGSSISNAVTLIGTTYYVKNGGNDNLDGLSDTNAWASLAKANSVMSAGDMVLFKRGSTFTSVSEVYISAAKGSGTVENPIKWGAYDSGAKPILNITSATGLRVEDVSNWIFESLNFQGSTQYNFYLRAG